jgi:hypothetical protein
MFRGSHSRSSHSLPRKVAQQLIIQTANLAIKLQFSEDQLV